MAQNLLLWAGIANGVLAACMFQWGVRVGRRQERDEFRRNPFRRAD